MSPTLLRAFFALLAAGGRSFRHLDVKAAFLTVPLDVELDVTLPEGFVLAGSSTTSEPGRRCRALTAIPGCPQGTRIWRKDMLATLNSLGFVTFLPSEPCLFWDAKKDPILLIVWVDDVHCSVPPTAEARRRESAFIQGMKTQVLTWREGFHG